MTIARVGKPGGHSVTENGVADSAGVGAGLFISLEGHRCGLSGAVAGLAMALQNGQYILEKQGQCGE